MAIEDAAVIADCLANFHKPKEGLKYFEYIRKPRTSFVQMAARRNAKVFHLSGITAFFRNLIMNYVGNKIFNRLYKYDALSVIKIKEM